MTKLALLWLILSGLGAQFGECRSILEKRRLPRCQDKHCRKLDWFGCDSDPCCVWVRASSVEVSQRLGLGAPLVVPAR